MKAILQNDGTLLVPVDGACAAECMTARDPRYTQLIPDAAVAAELCGTPEEDAILTEHWERRYQDHQPRSA